MTAPQEGGSGRPGVLAPDASDVPDASDASDASDRETAFSHRRVSSNEWLYLACEDLAEPFVIQIVVEGTGTIEPERLRRAVAEAAAVCPGSRLERRHRTWVDSGRAPEVRVLHDLLPPFREPLSAVHGHTAEVVLMPGARTTVVFRVHHAVMDGRGALTWVGEVFRALRGEEPLGAPSGLDDDALLDQLCAGRTRGRAAQRLRWRAPWPESTGPLRGLGERLRPDTSTRWSRRTVAHAPSALVARAAAAIADFADGPVRVMVPVDLRRHRPGLRATANLTLPVFLEGGPGRPWDEWHEQLLRQLAEERHLAAGEERAAARLPLGVLRAATHALDGAAVRSRRYLTSVVVSHLGRVEPEAVRAPGFEPETVYSVPLRVPYAPVSIATVSFRDHTELLLSYAGGRAQARGAEALATAVARALGTAAPGQAAPDECPGNADGPAADSADTLVELWRRQAERSADETALLAGEERVTYRELDRRSDVVAAELVARGIGRGAVVGLLADRSVAAVVGLWGVLKAGAAYLPLEPAHPAARIRALLTDAGAALCLAGAVHATVPGEACPVLVLEELPAHGPRPALPAVGPEDTAYVIYTSGSTGAPKGVQVPHRALVAYRAWAGRRYQVDAGTRFALFTSLAFDLAGTALLLPLLAGGSLALFPGEPTFETLTDLLTGYGVNALKLTPAHLDLITGLGVRPTGLRTVVVGGEQLRGSTAARAQRLFGPNCRIVNEYGPTEATIGCVVHTFDPERDGQAGAVPIGRPVEGTRALLLDSERRPVASGQTGELHLTGAQLASGYLGRPDLDQERFVTLEDGTRAYRTGDLARTGPGGELEFLGRADEQLSILGHRIEPAEVAAVLESHPGVRQAVVTGLPGRLPGQQRLCAYVTGTAEPAQVRAYAEGLLPRYLVPAAVVVVDSFPLTANGKTDMSALADPFAGQPAAPATQSPAPGDGLGAEVARVWARVLRVDEAVCAPEADFHALGGDSLAFLRMFNEVATGLVEPEHRTAFRRHLRDLLREPTVTGVCSAVLAATAS
ncbi:non-ribosomal peptide synthetase [Kitasatospora sp. NPDC093102]|uniref:non-ribosomal peptide synthetase n=1 Tax=Kitasatospora sp. NPDC093102 TaxID=3155069 RepID=UPI00342A9E2D